MVDRSPDLEAIRTESIRRNITRIYHFTQERKLVHILGDIGGIASTNFLQRHHADILDPTDPMRLDNHPDHISCSIQYPNVWYLKKAVEKEKTFTDWVILVIKPDVLWRKNALFCPVNSATNSGNLLRPGIAGFQQLFLNISRGRRFYRRTERTPLSCPTDGQAEVMIHEFIGIDMIIGIITRSIAQIQRTIGRLEVMGIPEKIIGSLDWIVSPALFSIDRKYRNDLIENGKFPPEQIFRESRK